MLLVVRLKLLTFLLCLWSFPALAGFSGDGFGTPGFFAQGVPTPSATYTGVFDAYGSQFQNYWALRAGSTAIAAAGTQKLITVVGVGGGAASVTCDVLVASNGYLGLTTNCSNGTYNSQAVTTFCGTSATSCVVSVVYDQGSGATNMAQTTAAQRPALMFNCGTPSQPACLVFNSSNSTDMLATIASTPQSMTVTSVAERYSNYTTYGGIFGDFSAFQLAFSYLANEQSMYAGSNQQSTAGTVADNTFGSIQGVFAGASSILATGSTQANRNPGSNNVNAAQANLGYGGGNLLTAYVTEVGVIATALTGTQLTAVCHNQTPASC